MMVSKPLTRFLSLGLPIALSALLLSGAARAAQLTYSLYVLGIPVAEATMGVDMTATGYGMSLNYRPIGLGSVMSGDHLEERSSGVFDRDGLVPQAYLSNARLHGKDRLLRMDYSGGIPSIAAIEPPNEAEREIVPPPLRARTIDPLSATAIMLRLATLSGKCDVSRRTYDGRRLEAFDARTAGEEDVPASTHSAYAGRGLRCDYASKVLAGFRVDSGRDEDARPRTGTLWLAPLIQGFPRLPIRGVIDTRFLGQATMYLTAVKP